MVDAETLRGLIARVEAASGPDRELDARILVALFAPPDAVVERSPINGRWCAYVPTGGRVPGRRLWETPAPWRDDWMGVTASIDAALALASHTITDGRDVQDILADALDRMSREGWNVQGDRTGEIARFVVIETLHAALTQAEARDVQP